MEIEQVLNKKYSCTNNPTKSFYNGNNENKKLLSRMLGQEIRTYGDGFDSHYIGYWTPFQYKYRLS